MCNEQTNQQTYFANQWITKQAAIDALGEKPLVWDDLSDFDLGKAAQWSDDVDAIKELPSAQPEQPTGVQDILQYLDEYLHPIVSPEHWSVYSELYDMVSMLPSEQPERKKGRWIGGEIGRCSVCGHEGCASDIWNNCERKFCPNCGADMRGEQDG